MISTQVLANCIEELHNITKVDLCVYDADGIEVVSTFDNEEVTGDMIRYFIASPADSRVIGIHHLLKVSEEGELLYALVARGSGDESYMVGKIAVSQLLQLQSAYKERFDKDNFIKNLLLDNLLLVDIYNRAKKLHIDTEVKRVIFIIETSHEKDSAALDNVRNLLGGKSRDFITAVDEKNIIVVKELSDKDGNKELEKMALEAVADRLGGKEPRKVIVKAPKIVSIVPAE